MLLANSLLTAFVKIFSPASDAAAALKTNLGPPRHQHPHPSPDPIIYNYFGLTWSTLLHSVALCCTLLHSTALCGTLRHSAALCGTLLHSAALPACFQLIMTINRMVEMESRRMTSHCDRFLCNSIRKNGRAFWLLMAAAGSATGGWKQLPARRCRRSPDRSIWTRPNIHMD